MLALQSANLLADMINQARTMEALDEALGAATNEMGFQYYALARHPRPAERDQRLLRLHNYPREWEAHYDRERLGICDPVHRASHRVATGFRWIEAGAYVSMGQRDLHMLAEARTHDIVDGFTVPANILGEGCGSVTFATRAGRPFPEPMLLYAQGFAGLAYQRSRVIEGVAAPLAHIDLTDRQVEVSYWVGRNKSDWEIAHILNVSQHTVAKHVRDLFGRLNVHKRNALALHVIRAGYLCFTDILD